MLLNSPVAQADPVSDYAAEYGNAVCVVLDAFPTFDGIMGVGSGIVDDGYLSYYQAGQVIRLSVEAFCPRHLLLLQQFAAYHGNTFVA